MGKVEKRKDGKAITSMVSFKEMSQSEHDLNAAG